MAFNKLMKKLINFQKKSKKELQEYLESHEVPVVKYKNKYYMVDHHHMCYALDIIDKTHVYIKIIKDMSTLDNFGKR